ncbi:hypothetical protein B0A48_00765 [Cryoendolithus antarcticus]|uniref:Metallo-beta-lactamase domain-containing protein n=1 Tax=Cryoendolithus antarcticus TaxID=1507870 RepID=A0A1V8TR80_9PEZI|nr:hypothetical protein B0A48_00765 [Cryoendolithus antarcticus]
MAPEPPQFHLSNGADRSPKVHSIYVPSTNSWQYVVADPSTQRCVVVDPVRDSCKDSAVLSTEAADKIIELVKQHGYIVDLIIETHSSPSPPQTAAWYLRMQFGDWQGSPPRLCSDGTVSAMEKLWQRKYGKTRKFVTSLGKALEDGSAIMVGRMKVQCLHLAGFGTPHRRGFVIGNCIFGAHSVALLSQDSWRTSWSSNLAQQDQMTAAPTNAETCNQVWSSMQRVLSLLESTRVYLEQGVQSAGSEGPWHDVRHCRAMNPYLGLSAQDLCIRWEGERQAHREPGQRRRSLLQAPSVMQKMRPKPPRNHGADFGSVELDSVELERLPREVL